MARTLANLSRLMTSLALSPVLAHVLEYRNKMALPEQVWLTVQQTLYAGWGLFVTPVELLSVTFIAMLVFALRKKKLPASLAISALVMLVLMQLILHFVIGPINSEIQTWTPDIMPENWMIHAVRWEQAHVIRALLAFVALCCLLRQPDRSGIARGFDDRS